MVTIAYQTEAVHYDLNVPGLANYVSAGVVHHNSGKSALAAEFAVAAMLGSRNPDARRWLDANGLDLDTIPPYPGRVLFSALTSNDSRKVLREKVRRLLPAGCKWRNERGDGEAEVSAPGAVGNNGTIVFKSNDQGARAYQADEFDIIILDEEHDSAVFGECLMRLGRRPWKGCYILLSMTPLKGMTWVYDDFQSEPKPGYRYAEIDGRDNPYIDQAGRAQRMARYGEHEKAARESGKFVALEGLVYTGWSRGVHLVPATPCPAEWRRVAGIDFGTSNPFACCLFAIDPRDDVLHLLATHYQAGLRWEEHAVKLRAMFEAHGWPETIWADPEEANGRMTLRNLGIDTRAARKDIRPGLNAVASRLALDAQGYPHLVVHDTVSNRPFVREIEGYVWAPRTGAKDSPDLPLKANDHACFPAGTMVATPNGPKAIERFLMEPGPVLAWGADGLVTADAVGLTTGVQPVVRAMFGDGSEVTATPDHPFMEETGAWARLDALRYAVRYDTMRYDRPHRDFFGLSGVERKSVLPVRRVLREHSAEPEAPASCGVGAGQWQAPGWLSRTPQQRRPARQPFGEPGVATGGTSPLRAHDDGASRGCAGSHGDQVATLGEGVARFPRGPRMAPGSHAEASRATGAIGSGGDDVFGLRVRNDGQWRVANRGLLLDSMQDLGAAQEDDHGGASPRRAETRDVRRGDEGGAVPQVAAQGNGSLSLARVVAIESAGVAPTYNLTVPGVGTFLLADGTIVHNCDAARYAVYNLAASVVDWGASY